MIPLLGGFFDWQASTVLNRLVVLLAVGSESANEIRGIRVLLFDGWVVWLNASVALVVSRLCRVKISSLADRVSAGNQIADSVEGVQLSIDCLFPDQDLS